MNKKTVWNDQDYCGQISNKRIQALINSNEQKEYEGKADDEEEEDEQQQREKRRNIKYSRRMQATTNSWVQAERHWKWRT